MNDSQKTEQRVELGNSAKGQTTPLPYASPAELWRAFKNGAKFVLHYHGRTFDVERMEPREKVVYVQPPMMAVKVFADGRGAEGTPAIWLEQQSAAHLAQLPIQDTVPPGNRHCSV